MQMLIENSSNLSTLKFCGESRNRSEIEANERHFRFSRMPEIG